MKEVPIWEKSNLSLEEAAAYSGIDINKLRELISDKDCQFVLWIGKRDLIWYNESVISRLFPLRKGV